MRGLVFTLLFLLFACSVKNTNGDGGDTLAPDERATFDTGSGSVAPIVLLVEAADSFFQFDPTLDATKTAPENVTAIQTEITKNLGADADGGPVCGNVSLAGSTLTVSFGAAPGCVLKTGITVSGTAAVTVTKTTALSVAFTFTSFTVNGETLGGTATFTTTNSTSFTLTANLTHGSSTFSSTGFTVAGSPGAVTLDGAFTTSSGDTPTTMTFMGVLWKMGDCYPSAGSFSIKKGLIVTTVAFSATTPTTGMVQVTVGKRTTIEKLPKYGKCG